MSEASSNIGNTDSVSLDDSYTFLVGTYSDPDVLAHQPHAPGSGVGIYTMMISKDGQLVSKAETPCVNPAVLIPHSNGKLIYAIVETIRSKGEVLHYEIGDNGQLLQAGSFMASGKSTCYLALSPQKDAAIVINYWDAIIDVAEVDEQGRLGSVIQSFRQHYRKEGEWRQVEYREDHWQNRQVGPHAHCAHFWKDWVFIPDLGENAVFQYRYNPGSKQLTRDTFIKFEAGSGPRHMAMHPTLDICYISNELFNSVCVARLDDSNPQQSKERLIPIQYESTLENRNQVSYVSEIKLSPDARFLYVSNRGDNSLAIFRVLDDGRLDRLGLVPTGGKFPRHFAITPCGRAVLVANQDSSNLCLFHRDVDTGLLQAVGDSISIPAPNYIRFI